MTSRTKMITYSGLEVFPLELGEADIRLADVAHALALVNRFGGHTRFPISVAQHAVYCSWLCEPYGLAAAWKALHHDDSEYLLGDMTKWVKQSPVMAGYRELEERVQATCYRAFGCDEGNNEHIRWADDLMVRFEAKMAYTSFTFDDKVAYPDLTEEEITQVNEACPRVLHWTPWCWEYAEEMFIQRAIQLVPTAGAL